MALLSLSKAVLIFAVLGGMDMRYGYARVSTRLQAIHGNSLDEQVEQLQNRGCEKVITEQYTGSTVQRPLLEQLLAKLHAGDTLMVTKLDRLARTAAEGSKMITGARYKCPCFEHWPNRQYPHGAITCQCAAGFCRV